ncbi:CLIP domain-containing serine protease B9-like [Cotesia typhae]|uniref:CLIP domain-containing serine protease B9-like n=1 Tax=Cotesia typhae TaxID=2053667 RepID=UPI003D696118
MDRLKLPIIITLTIIIVTSVTIFAQNERNFDCTSPTGLQGLCINIADCPPLLRLIKMVPLYQKDVAYLRGSQCGITFDNMPKVCCVPDDF